MPRQAKLDDDAQVHQDVSGNGINEQKLTDFVKSIEAESAEIDTIMADAAAACQPHIDQIKEIKKAAAEAGIAKKPLSAKLRERSLLRKADKCRNTLSEDQRDLFDEITKKLGELPLFQNLDS
jgi:hypothetical protein